MITGLSAKTFDKLQLNAGIFLKDVDVSTATDKAALLTMIKTAKTDGKYLGATRGGGSFVCTPEIRNIEADGMRMQFVGSEIADNWDIRLTTTLIETTPDNFAAALLLPASSVSKSGSVTTIQPKASIDNGAYIPTLVWVGDTSKGFVAITIKNALNLAGANFTFTDKGEGTLPMEFTAHQDSVENEEDLPCNVKFFEEAA